MKMERMLTLGAVVLASAVVVVGCGKKSDVETEPSAGVAERTGAAVDSAAEKTVDAAKTTGTAAKDMTGKAMEKTGAALEKAGDAVEGAGSSMRKPTDPIPVEK